MQEWKFEGDDALSQTPASDEMDTRWMTGE